MRRELRRCDGECLDAVEQVLVIDTVLERGGYAVVNFEKPSDSVAALGPQLLFRVRITAGDPYFELGMTDGKSTVHFDCLAPKIDETSDFLIDFDQESRDGVTIRREETRRFSIGFAKDAGSMPGPHRMEVYGLVSGVGLGNSRECRCSRRER